MEFPRLYAIVDRGTLDAHGVRVRAFADELLAGGVRLVQYRDKVNRPQEVLRACEEIASVFEGVDTCLILNDRADLAGLLGWGVHVGQEDLSVPDVRKVLTSHLSRNEERDDLGIRIVGVSTHTVEQVTVASALAVNYVAVGPVFGTATKPDAEAVVGLEGVRAARALTAKPLVAIGGIGLRNCRSVVEAGADSVAVISGLMVDGRRVRDVARDFLNVLR
jgi:thiamine-phosphate pyrophosphorylase